VQVLHAVRRRERKECLLSSEESKRESEWTEWISDSSVMLLGAYAMTVHRVQGQQLSSAHVELDESMFESGQAYTAISRVTSEAGLTLTRYDPRAFIVDPAVVAFDRECRLIAAHRQVLHRNAARALAYAARRAAPADGALVGQLLYLVADLAGWHTPDEPGLRAAFRRAFAAPRPPSSFQAHK
jgi:hypothetical protein